MKDVEDIKKLKDIFNDSIYSIIKYGFGKRNILVVLNDMGMDYMMRIKPYLFKLKKNKNILVLTKKNISKRSIGVDFLNIKLTSVVIYGNDIFKNAKIDTARIKRQIRYEANRALINLKNEFLSCKWSWRMRELLFTVIPRTLPLIVAHLYVLGEKIPNAIPDTINRYIKHNEDAIALLSISRNLSKDKLKGVFQDIFDFFEKLEEKV
jgi:hypothetical protein